MGTTLKGLTLSIGGDTTELTKALKEPNKEVKNLQDKLSTVNNTLKFNPASTELLAQKQRILGDTIKSNESKLNLLKQAQKEFIDSGKNIDGAEYIELQRQIAQTENKIKSLKKEQSIFNENVQALGIKLNDVGTKAENTGKKLMGVSTASGAMLGLSAKAAIDWETAWTGVLKTVEGTPEQLAKIEQGIKDLATTTSSSKEEIASVAESAGQLGIATDDVLEFTETMVMLGDTTNIEATEAASALAKFANITKMSADDYDNLGSAIVDLGNNFATTEADIVEMSTRLAATGELAGLSEPDILGLATALSSVGIEAEAGGSAFSKLLKNIQVSTELGGESLEQFASVAGVSADEFKQAFEKDAAGAVSMFISGLNDTERNGKSAIAVLDDMGIKEVRMSNAILSLANNSDLLNRALDTSSTAWQENTALQDEAQKRYDTVSAKLSQLKERFSNVAVSIGEALLPVIENVMDALAGFAMWLDNLDPNMKTLIATIGLLVAAIGPVLIVVGKISKGISSIIDLGNKLGPVFTKIGNGFTSMKNMTSSAFNGLKSITSTAFAGIKNIISTSLTTVKNVSSTIFNGIKTVGTSAFTGLKNIASTSFESLKTVVTTSLTTLKTTASSIFTSLKTTAMTAFTGIKTAASTAFTAMKTVVLGAFSAIMAHPIIAGITAIIAIIVLLYNKCEWFRDAVNEVITNVCTFVEEKFTAIKEFITVTIPAVINNIVTWFSELPDKLWKWLNETIEKVKTWGRNFIAEGNQRAKDFIDGVVTFIKELPGKVWDWLCDVVDNVITWGRNLVSQGNQNARNLVNGIVNNISSLPGKMLETGKNIVTGLWNGIVNAKDWVLDKISGFVDDIVGGIKDFFGIHSPSRVMADQVGKYVSAGIGEGVQKNEKLALNPLDNLAKKMATVDLDSNLNASVNKTLSTNNTINLETTIVSQLDGRVVNTNVVRRTTRIQNNALRFKGA